MKIGIVGGGPGGLALAHALLTLPGPKAIDSVTIYDRDGVLKPGVGGGFQLSCGAATLKRLGIDVSSVGTPLRSVLSRTTISGGSRKTGRPARGGVGLNRRFYCR